VEEFMPALKPRRLWLEHLETRDVPSSLTESYPTIDYQTSLASTSILDPTLSPSDPTSTSVAVIVTAISAPTEGQGVSITVSGLNASNLQAGASLQLLIGATSYAVSSYTLAQDGTCRLWLSNAATLPETLTVSSTVTVVIGGGSTSSSTTTAPPPSTTVIDPTLDPQG
jgi:hypothetical protein